VSVDSRGLENEMSEKTCECDSRSGEPDSVKMKEMCGRLIDAIAAATDRDRVELLIDHFVSVRMTELDMMTHESAVDDEYWSDDPEAFREDLESAERALAAA
jgi:hypothetical protein